MEKGFLNSSSANKGEHHGEENIASILHNFKDSMDKLGSKVNAAASEVCNASKVDTNVDSATGLGKSTPKVGIVVNGDGSVNGDGPSNQPPRESAGPIISDWSVDDGDINLSTLVDKNVSSGPKTSYSAPTTCGTSEGKGNVSGKEQSFASLLGANSTSRKVNFRQMINEDRVPNHDTKLPKEAMEPVLGRYENTLVGYFLGKAIAFPIVQNYVTNTWKKFGVQKIMKNEAGVFLFKFSSKDGLEQVLQQGPWLIRHSPLILRKWSLNVPLTKNEVTTIPVWVKLHNVPIVAYSEVGLSLIATQVGKPVMLDSFTSSMCVDSWGRISYARALVEVCSNSELKKEVSMAIPLDDDSGYSTEIIRVEYEWTPPHCSVCKIFGHTLSECPKQVKEVVHKVSNVVTNASIQVVNNDEGFTEVRNRKNKGKSVVSTSQPKPIGGVKLSKPKANFWRPKVTTTSNQVGTKKDSDPKGVQQASTSNVKSGKDPQSSNSFGILESLVDEDVLGFVSNGKGSQDQPISNMDSQVPGEASKSSTIPSSTTSATKKALEQSTIPSPSTSASKRGNPFSKVGEVVVSDSDEDEVYEPNDYLGDDYFSDEYAAQVNDLPEQFKEFKLQGRAGK